MNDASLDTEIPTELGPQELTETDTTYQGSTYAEVHHAVMSEPYYQSWSFDTALPRYRVNLMSVLKGFLPFGPPYAFLQAARRTVSSSADLRWGSDNKGFRRLLHPNGVCLSGRWEITEPNDYSGYFQSGSQALVIARYSTCCTETRRGYTRSLSMVGKLYPTTDRQDTTRHTPASFITQQDLGGENTPYINDAELRNAPDTRAWRRGLGLPVFLVTGLVFLRADRQPSVRQLYQIAELGQAAGDATKAPRFMRLVVDAEQPRIEGHNLDFRHEIMAQIYDSGKPQPKRHLIFHIEVSNDGESHGLPVFERREIREWQRIGRLVFDQAAVSYNGDFVIHFNHPPWRDDRNDPSTASKKRPG